jgi:PAS domain S-box-containing protein
LSVPPTMRLLILEDVPEDAELEQHALRRAGIDFEALTTATKAGFLAALDSFHPDLIIVDYNLPDIDGLTAIRLVRQRDAEVPVLLVTGALDDEAAVEVVRAGATNYIRKDRLARLPIAVKDALEAVAARREKQEAQHELAINIGVLRSEHELSPDGILVVDGKGNILSFNDRFAKIWGIPAELLVTKPGSTSVLEAPILAVALGKVENQKEFLARLHDLYEHSDEQAHDEVTLKNGQVLERHTGPITQADGAYIGRIWFFHDITERKRAEQVLEQLNRTLRVVSAGDALLVRAKSEAELLGGMCRVAVEIGGYRMAWIGFADDDATKFVHPVASDSDDSGFLDAAVNSGSNDERGNGPTGTAFRTGLSQVSQNIATDPRMEPWRAEALKRDYHASAAFPLKHSGTVFGTFTLYAGTIDAFTPEEQNRLSELSNDLAFGIRALRDREERAESIQRLDRAMRATVQALANTVEVRDPYTAGHQRNVGKLAAAIARELGLPEDEVVGIELAGMVHDVGKIQVPAELLSKPGRLLLPEFELIKMHAQAGHDIVKGVDFPWPIAQMILQHHERRDGSGYPQGLKGDEIRRDAMIISVADVVEAMMARRPYRQALGLDAALAEIEQGKGRLYDPEVVDTCVKLFRDKGFVFQ